MTGFEILGVALVAFSALAGVAVAKATRRRPVDATTDLYVADSAQLAVTPATLRYQALNQEEKLRAIQETSSPKRLQDMWRAWEARGYSREGILFGRVAERLQELGVPLSGEEQDAISIAMNPPGRGLPVIRGRGGVQ